MIRNVFILGVDGLGRAILESDTPAFKDLMEKSTTYTNMRTVFPSISAQAWGSLLLSVSPTKHGYTNDSIRVTPHEIDDIYPSLFRVIRENKKDFAMASICNWNPINVGIFENIPNLVKKTAKSDKEIAEKTADYIKNSGDGIVFVHFDEMDEAGHTHDYFTEKYMSEIIHTDNNIALILNAIEEAGKMEDSLIFVVTDHGGGANPKDHGSDGDKDMNIFAIAYGDNFEKGKKIAEDTSIMDISPTILNLLGIETPQHMEGKTLER